VKKPTAKELAKREKEEFVTMMKANCPDDHKYVEKMSDQALSGEAVDEDYQSYQSSDDLCNKRRIDLNLYDYEESDEEVLEEDKEGLDGGLFSNALGGLGQSKEEAKFERKKTTLTR
jgi:hypothetical protein